MQNKLNAFVLQGHYYYHLIILLLYDKSYQNRMQEKGEAFASPYFYN